MTIEHPHEAARTATLDDLSALARLATVGADEKAAQKGGGVWTRRERRTEPLDTALTTALAAEDHEVAVGTIDDTIVGYAVVRTERLSDGGLLGVLDDIFVEPGARAIGVGEALMSHVLDWCRAQGCFGVDSLALPGDRATKNFFESFGLVARAIVVHRRL